MEPRLGHTNLHRALVRGREAVELYRHVKAELGHGWEEEPATIQLLQACSPEARFTRFNKHEEGKLGADWMWWWQGPSGECFGTLRPYSWSSPFEISDGRTGDPMNWDRRCFPGCFLGTDAGPGTAAIGGDAAPTLDSPSSTNLISWPTK